MAEGGQVETAGASGGGEIAVEAERFVTAGLVAAEGVDGAGRVVTPRGRIAIAADHVGLGGKVSVSGGHLAVTSSGLLSLAEGVEAKGLAGAGGRCATGRTRGGDRERTTRCGNAGAGDEKLVADIQVTTTVDVNSCAGDYPIKARGGSTPNYTFKYVDGYLILGVE